MKIQENIMNNENITENEIQEFFDSLNKENEEKYINDIKNSSLKIWNYKDENGLTPLHQSISLELYKLSKEIIIFAKNNLSSRYIN